MPCATSVHAMHRILEFEYMGCIRNGCQLSTKQDDGILMNVSTFGIRFLCSLLLRVGHRSGSAKLKNVLM